MAGVRLISKEEESRQKVKGDDGNGLWNAQLFPPPAVVPVPDCPSGCARMEPLEVRHSEKACLPPIISLLGSAMILSLHSK